MKKIKRKLRIFKERSIKKKLNSVFDWVVGAELVELTSCDIKEDPVRPELDLVFRRSYGRKIFGVKYKKIYLQSCTLVLLMIFQKQQEN